LVVVYKEKMLKHCRLWGEKKRTLGIRLHGGGNLAVINESCCYPDGAKKGGFLPPTHKLPPHNFKKKYKILK
jgi:hypothetical protein